VPRVAAFIKPRIMTEQRSAESFDPQNSEDSKLQLLVKVEGRSPQRRGACNHSKKPSAKSTLPSATRSTKVPALHRLHNIIALAAAPIDRLSIDPPLLVPPSTPPAIRCAARPRRRESPRMPIRAGGEDSAGCRKAGERGSCFTSFHWLEAERLPGMSRGSVATAAVAPQSDRISKARIEWARARRGRSGRRGRRRRGRR
jgi:hypothetical protein